MASPLKLILIVLIVVGCGRNPKTPNVKVKQITDTLKVKELKPIETPIQADFNGDGKTEIAQTRFLKLVGEGREETAFQMKVHFSDKTIPVYSFSTDGESVELVTEGNLDGKGGSEFSLVIPPLNGNLNVMKTLTLTTEGWEELFDPFLTPNIYLFKDSSDFVPYSDRVFIKEEELCYLDYKNNIDQQGKQLFGFERVKIEFD